MAEIKENNIEWYLGDDRCTVYLTQVRYINKVKKLAEKHPDQVVIDVENPDGSILAHMPLKWAVRFSNVSGRPMTDEEKEIARERLKKAREGMKS